MALPEPPLPTLDVAVHSTLKEMLVVLRRIDERLPPAPPASPQTDNAGTTSHPDDDSALSCDVGATVRNAGNGAADTVGAEWASPAETGLSAASNEGGLQGPISTDSQSLSEPVNIAASDSGQPSAPKIYNLLESILGVLRQFDEVAIDEVDLPWGSAKKSKKSFKHKWFGIDKQQPDPALGEF
ncbi:hypothetical protein C8R45DRAFT_563719 [Mycena sanguinolenta]|nr:hypothetical protein C8R45DRAFT_563719 [Mycena sanguinolenta]